MPPEVSIMRFNMLRQATLFITPPSQSDRWALKAAKLVYCNNSAPGSPFIRAAVASSDHIYSPTPGIKVMKTRNNAAGEEK